MTHVGLVIFVILTFEILKYFKISNLVKENLKIYKSFLKLFNNKQLSDSLKEKEIMMHSKNLIFISTKIFLILSLIFGIILIENVLIDKYLKFLISVKGILETILIFSIYYFSRKALSGKI